MKKAVLSILLILALLLGGLFLYAGLMIPVDFRVTRSTVIQAPATEIFPYLNNHMKMNSWNPWIKMDPNVKLSYSGPPEDVGAIIEWDGNRDVGAGRATITHSTPGYLVRMKMDWFKPMEGTSTVDFSLKQIGESTTVEWIIFGKNNIVLRVMCIFLDIDKMIGGSFESGLSELKKKVEAEHAGKVI